jgi:hypothetical protein
VVGDALDATQRCGKYTSAVVNQHATIQVKVFSVGAASRLYNEDLRQLRHRIESSSRVPSEQSVES